MDPRVGPDEKEKNISLLPGIEQFFLGHSEQQHETRPKKKWK
jgi:hypothetical protein